MCSALKLKGQTLAEQLLVARHYVAPRDAPAAAGTPNGDAADPSALGLVYDPRFLLFEFTHNIVLRKAQVELVREFVAAVRRGAPLVKQMLMGGGKTTVVGPLLALLLGDGETLVVQTMPPALLEQSKATLRATFSSIIRKRVFTLSFDRSSEMRWATVDKLQSAARNRGVVMCTASTVKSLQLKLLEKLDVLRDERRKQHPSMEHDVRALVQVLAPLPRRRAHHGRGRPAAPPAEVGAQLPDRRQAQARLLARAVDVRDPRSRCSLLPRAQVDVGALPPERPRAQAVLDELQTVIEDGYEQRALQRSPHLVLLNVEWYHARCAR